MTVINGKINGQNKMHRPILRTTIGLQSLALAGEALKSVPKKVEKPIKPKKLIKGFTTIIVGLGLLKPTAKLVQSI